MKTSQTIAVVASILVISAIFYAVLLHASLSTTGPPPITPPASKGTTTVSYTTSDQLADEANKSLVAANTGFSLKLLKELQAEDEGKDIIISPLSVSTALAMAINGANGSTRDAMASTLGLSGMSLAEVNRGYEDLMGSLVGADGNATVSMGNSVWVRDVFAPYVKENFTYAMSSYYGGGLYVRDFGPGTVQEINGWVSNQTRGKITQIVDNLSNDVMVLVNAIYFRGNWTKPFEAGMTSDRNFTLQGGEVIKVPTMMLNTKLSYFNDDTTGAEMARLPYGTGRISMYVVLPPLGQPLGTYLDGINTGTLDTYFSGMTTRTLQVEMPKLKLEYGVKDLKDALTKLGMGVAFNSSAADLSGLAHDPGQRLYIDYVYHKAMVEVNENGTVAAGATAVGISATAVLAPTEVVHFNVDRPYIFLIRDDRSGSILFLAEIFDPTQTVSP